MNPELLMRAQVENKDSSRVMKASVESTRNLLLLKMEELNKLDVSLGRIVRKPTQTKISSSTRQVIVCWQAKDVFDISERSRATLISVKDNLEEARALLSLRSAFFSEAQWVEQDKDHPELVTAPILVVFPVNLSQVPPLELNVMCNFARSHASQSFISFYGAKYIEL